MLSSFSKNIDFYLPTGTPGGINILKTGGITLAPRLISVSPSIGSPAGSLLTVVVKGLGVQSSSVTLTKNDGTDVCSSVEITEYGIVKCQT